MEKLPNRTANEMELGGFVQSEACHCPIWPMQEGMDSTKKLPNRRGVKRKFRGLIQAQKYAGASKAQNDSSMGYQAISDQMSAHEMFLRKFDFAFFMTITFNEYATLYPDKDLKHVLRVINKKLFGNRHLKDDDGHLKMLVVRELDRKRTSHYHLLIVRHPKVTHHLLGETLIAASKQIKSMKSINDLGLLNIGLTHPARFGSTIQAKRQHLVQLLNSKDEAINLAEIPSDEDRISVTRYVMKDMPKHGFQNYAILDNLKDYYNFSTNSR